MLTLAASLIAGGLGAGLGFLVRMRWWPMTWRTQEMQDGEWRVMASGGFPYTSVSISGRFPVTPLGLAELAKTVQAGHYVRPVVLSA